MSKTQRALSPSKANSSKRGKTNKAAEPQGIATEHIQREDTPWAITIPDHEPRKDSDAYKIARKVMSNVVKEVKEFLGTHGPYQDHHGGGLWVKDKDGWLLIKNLAGMEWSAQFCADPAKVDRLRQFAKRIYEAFPASIPAFKQFGFHDVETCAK